MEQSKREFFINSEIFSKKVFFAIPANPCRFAYQTKCMNKESLRLVFGLKVRLLRQSKELTLQQLVDRTGIALSYLHDIENGKKYPSLEKITLLAKALDTSYEALVSPHGIRQLDPVIDLLESDFFQTYPLEVFGLQPGSVIESMARAPEKLGAFISTILKITRSYHLTKESINLVALRSYQDMHENYFSNLEKAAQEMRREKGWAPEQTLTPAVLEKALLDQFHIRTDRTTLAQKEVLRGVRSCYSPEKRVLFLNQSLSAAQENFLLGRELGFQYLKIEGNRPYETSVLETANFETLLHNFQASYFASALLMEEFSFAKAVRDCAALPVWQPEAWLSLLDRFGVTPEMLLQRLSNILPTHFGEKDLFFIRMEGNKTLDYFDMTKELHLGGQQSPYQNAYGAHYCRRWISIDILRQLSSATQFPVAAAQLSEYWKTPNQYLCISMAKPDASGRLAGVSVTIGVRVTDSLRASFRFLQDPALLRRTVHTICETCDMVDCSVRAAEPLELEENRRKEEVQAALRGVISLL